MFRLLPDVALQLDQSLSRSLNDVFVVSLLSAMTTPACTVHSTNNRLHACGL